MEGKDTLNKLEQLIHMIDTLKKKDDINKEDIDIIYSFTSNIIEQYSNYIEHLLNYKEILDSLDDGIYVSDQNAITVYINDAYLKLRGISSENVMNKSIYDILKSGDVFKHSIIPEIIRTKGKVTATGTDIFGDGKEFNAYATGKPVFDQEGNVKLAVVSIFDTNKMKLRYDEFKEKSNREAAIRITNKDNNFKNAMIGTNESMKSIRKTIDRVAATDATVLITGESGVGKESVADRVYYLSRRRDCPYIKVNCTAIPDNLLESELFGYERGSFTGANPKGKIGLFEMANNGTILLDEIGDLPIELQTKLLRVIQQKEIMKIGSNKPINIDVRIIAATNANLRDKIHDGTFREDLYYRLSVVPINVPPLRQRKDDIEKLTKYFFNDFCNRYNRPLKMTNEFMDVLKIYDWPGNVREMQNIIEYLVICSENNCLDLNKFYEVVGKNIVIENDESNEGLYDSLIFYEKNLIVRALKETGGVRKAANKLKVNPSTISRKAKRYGIKLPD